MKYRENSHVGMNAKLHWYNDELNKTKIQVNRLKLYKDWCMCYDISKVDEITTMFRSAMKNYREKLRLAKLSYNENFINKSANKCKAAWNVINSFKSEVPKSNTVNPVYSAAEYCGSRSREPMGRLPGGSCAHLRRG